MRDVSSNVATAFVCFVFFCFVFLPFWTKVSFRLVFWPSAPNIAGANSSCVHSCHSLITIFPANDYAFILLVKVSCVLATCSCCFILRKSYWFFSLFVYVCLFDELTLERDERGASPSPHLILSHLISALSSLFSRLLPLSLLCRRIFPIPSLILFSTQLEPFLKFGRLGRRSSMNLGIQIDVAPLAHCIVALP